MNEENRYQPPKAEVADVRANDDSELASRGARFGAALIDGLLAAGVIFPIMFTSGYIQRAQMGQVGFEDQVEYGLLGLVLYIVFHGYLLHKSGQTIGKRLVGTRIVAVDDNTILPLWKILTLRMLPLTLVAQIPGVGPFLSLVDSLFVFRGDRRCVHDLIAGTKVVTASTAWSRPADGDNAG